MPKSFRNPNGYGSVVKLSGHRRCPFEVRVNTRMDGRGYPVYDVLGRYPDRKTAVIELAKFNVNPYEVKAQNYTFSDVYKLWYESKYNGIKKYSESSKNCSKAAYKHCEVLYDIPLCKIKVVQLQTILDNPKLSRSTVEHIKNLFCQVFKYAMINEYIVKNPVDNIVINTPEDDEHGIPFTIDDIKKLWASYSSGVPDADLVLMLIYTGWRITEFINVDIDLNERTMKGGMKTAAGKDRIVPIHPDIMQLVENKYNTGWYNLNINVANKHLKKAVKASGIEQYHTCHDCRHTFITLLDNAGANTTAIHRLVGHADSSITEKIYTHKDLEQLRKAVELIKI